MVSDGAEPGAQRRTISTSRSDIGIISDTETAAKLAICNNEKTLITVK